MRHQRCTGPRWPALAASWAWFAAAGSWRANETSMPNTSEVASREVPPAEMNGNGMPVTGSNPIT
jgi:hypothetical protein